jgi:putative Mn2+ efflux pump MntP
MMASVVASGFIVAALALDFPRALCGIGLGLLGQRLPFATILIPAGSFLIAGLGELIYQDMGRTQGPSVASFVTGLFAANAASIGVYRLFYDRQDRD